MNDGGLTRLEQAWSAASDADVTSALSEPDEFDAAVFAVIEREAERRCLEHSDQVDAFPDGLANVTRPFRAVLAFLATHRCLAAAFPAVLVALCGMFFSSWAWSLLGDAWPIWSVFMALTYLGGVATTAWPPALER